MHAVDTVAATSADAFAERLFGAILGAFDIWSIYVGDKFGLYDALVARGPLTVAELAEASGMHERYAREWLEQQAVTGILRVDDAASPASQRRYAVPEGHAEVLTDRESLTYFAPFVRLVIAAGVQLPALLDAYRSGGGVTWAQYGPDMRTGQADMNRPWFLHALASEWFPNVADLEARLQAGGRVADIGCGEGWSSIAIATGYPDVMVDGFDVDGPSIAAARRHAERAGVADRVRFFATDAASADGDGTYDLVAAFECLHDMPRPVEVLRAMRRAAAPDGHVIVMDERVAERFDDHAGDVERLMYGFSMFICLPDGMSHQPSAATGTVMRPETLRQYAREAGFADIEVLPIDNDLWRFYRLTLAPAKSSTGAS